MADNTIKIGGELESMATGKIVAAASAIKDKTRNKTQEAINGDVEQALSEQSEQFERLAEETAESVSSAENAAKQSKQYLADLEEAMTELPDGQAVSAQVAVNKVEIEKVDGKIPATQEDGYYLCDSNGNIVLQYTDKGLDTASVNPRLKKEEFAQSNTDEEGWYLCDAQGNVVIKFTDKGLDAAKVSQRLKVEELAQSNTEEEGAYIADANGNYIFIANSSGVNLKVSAALLNYLKSKIEGGGGGGTSYDNIGYPILDDTNPLAMLIRGRSRARLFKTWGVVGASFETGLIECYNDGTATTMTDTGNDWPSLFGEMNNVEVGNYAIAGSTLRNWLSSANGWTKLNNDTAKQAYLVNMSSNDNDTNKYNEPIGDITTDIDYNNWQNNAATWVGCLATIIQRIREKSPRCYIFLATRRNASGAKSNARANQMCQALRQVCTCFPNVYLVDMWEYGANWDDTNFKKEFRCGGHPNRNGHIYLADAFNTYFDWIIRNNPIGMRDAAFIGTDYQDKDNY